MLKNGPLIKMTLGHMGRAPVPQVDTRTLLGNSRQAHAGTSPCKQPRTGRKTALLWDKPLHACSLRQRQYCPLCAPRTARSSCPMSELLRCWVNGYLVRHRGAVCCSRTGSLQTRVDSDAPSVREGGEGRDVLLWVMVAAEYEPPHEDVVECPEAGRNPRAAIHTMGAHD